MLKVLMLGDSQVGKTTYMGAMYNTMADDQGYCIRATDYNNRQSLERLGALIKKGEYPQRTQVRSTYDFTFRYNYEEKNRKVDRAILAETMFAEIQMRTKMCMTVNDVSLKNS